MAILLALLFYLTVSVRDRDASHAPQPASSVSSCIAWQQSRDRQGVWNREALDRSAAPVWPRRFPLLPGNGDGLEFAGRPAFDSSHESRSTKRTRAPRESAFPCPPPIE